MKKIMLSVLFARNRLPRDGARLLEGDHNVHIEKVRRCKEGS